jgi:hypothetical protein
VKIDGKTITTTYEAENELYWLDTPKADYCDCGSGNGCVECNPAEQHPERRRDIKRLKKFIADRGIGKFL